LSITIREAAAAFLQELDEAVVRPKYERIAKALERLVAYLTDNGIVEVGLLEIDDVERFLQTASSDNELTRADVSDVWHSVRRFLKWLKRKKYAVEVYREFAARKKDLREELKRLSERR